MKFFAALILLAGGLFASSRAAYLIFPNEIYFRSLIEHEAIAHGIEPEIFLAVVAQESNFVWYARSRSGAIGLSQLMPGTAYWACSDLFPEGSDLRIPWKNIKCGARYFSQQLRTFKNPTCALYAYNAGPGDTIKAGCRAPTLEAADYAPKVINYYWMYRVDSLIRNYKSPEKSWFERIPWDRVAAIAIALASFGCGVQAHRLLMRVREVKPDLGPFLDY